MLLKEIIVKNFRSFKQTNFIFNPFLTIVIGENARGKTNLLEAIHTVLNGSGFRENKEEELILIGQKRAEIKAVFISAEQKYNFRVAIEKSDTKTDKIFQLEKTKKTFFQYHKETTKTVLFAPEQIEIVTGSPSQRRKYFDKVISSYDLEYKKRLINYENALRKRNKVLETYRNDQLLREELVFWNDYLIKQASYLTKKREDYLNFLNSNKKIDDKEFSIEYLKNQIDKARLDNVFEVERRFRKTLIGPQKDDFALFEKSADFEKNLHSFGSRSEQRLTIFWLKLNEIRFHEQKFGKKPILLLDDVFSELDLKNKKLVLDLIKKYQTVATTTEIELLDLSDMPKSIIKL